MNLQRGLWMKKCELRSKKDGRTRTERPIPALCESLATLPRTGCAAESRCAARSIVRAPQEKRRLDRRFELFASSGCESCARGQRRPLPCTTACAQLQTLSPPLGSKKRNIEKRTCTECVVSVKVGRCRFTPTLRERGGPPHMAARSAIRERGHSSSTI